jgi:hypothetical protein
VLIRRRSSFAKIKGVFHRLRVRRCGYVSACERNLYIADSPFEIADALTKASPVQLQVRRERTANDRHHRFLHHARHAIHRGRFHRSRSCSLCHCPRCAQRDTASGGILRNSTFNQEFRIERYPLAGVLASDSVFVDRAKLRRSRR